MKVLAFPFFTALLALNSTSYAQTIPVGTQLTEENWRRAQLKGEKDLNTSFTIRPIYSAKLTANHPDSVSTSQDTLSETHTHNSLLFRRKYGSAYLLPVTIKHQYNSDHPYGWNDGSMIAAKGYQGQLSFGLYSKMGPLSIQLQPEAVLAQNKKFATFPEYFSDSIWKSHYNVLNRIDNPERYGEGSYVKMFPGQSSIRLNHKKLSFGVSTENLWWGPGVRNSLIMSNNAPGFAHITFNTTSPVISPIGSFEWQIIAGTLKNSNILPPDTNRTFQGRRLYSVKPDDQRYLNGMIVTWQPKWTRGLHLGFSRVFYQYQSNISKSLNGYLPVVGSFFKNKARDENSFGRDQLLSVFIRLVLPKENAEVYAEYGRNDHSADLRDLLLEPEHARAYILGLRKLFTTSSEKDFELFMEFTHMQNPETRNVRDLEGWYTHYQVRHGFTNLGQVIGAGIGPGGNSQTLGVNWLRGFGQFGASVERVVWNNDFYYDAFQRVRNFSSHWVDLSVNLNAALQHKRFIYAANLSRVKSLNYHWWQNDDVNNWHAQLSASYLF